MKQKCSKTGRLSGGFTLVELIVVIAILAILAGVAYPVYTGYINKANEAADQMLIGAVNEAFRSALIDHGKTDGLPAMATATLTMPDKKVSDVSSDGIVGLNETFLKYFGSNKDTAFKVVDGLLYSQTQGFYGSFGENNFRFANGSLAKKGIDAKGRTMWEWTTDEGTFTITTSADNIESFNNSSFGKNMTMEGLMGEVDKLVTGVTGVVSSVNPEEYLTKDIMDMLEKAGYEPGTDDYKKAAVRALVVQSAMQADCWTVDGLLEDMKKGRLSTIPKRGEEDGEYSYAASANAMLYAMVTGYAQSEAGKNAKIKIHLANNGGTDFNGTVAEFYDEYVTKVLNGEDGALPSQAYGGIMNLLDGVINTPEYKNYLDSGEGRKDIEGYLGSMEFIRDNADSIISSKTLDAGYNDPALAELLSALFGNG